MKIPIERERYMFFFKITLIMKLLFFLCSFYFLQASTFVYAQKINISLKNQSLENALNVVCKQTNYDLVYDSKIFKKESKINLNLKTNSIEEALDKILMNQNLEYEIRKNTLIVRQKEAPRLSQSPENLIPFIKQQVLTGTVKDEHGKALVGVTVQAKGSKEATSTDENGSYSITLSSNTVLLVFSSIGFETQEINVLNKSTVNVVLFPKLADLDEVVVVGYGTQRKADVSGSITTVSGDRLANLPTAGAAEALQGMASGLSINMGSGAPGENPSMMVRGVTSWGSSNDPLVVIDGVPGEMSFVNPEDIKSISILKDAALASIYGARSAAGVILVETHRGQNKAPKMQVSAYYGVEDLPKRMEVANSAEYIKINKMALQNAGIAQNRWPKYIEEYEKNPSQFADTDWQDVYYRYGNTSKYNLGYTAGNEFSNVAFSGYYSKIKGIVIGTDSEKYGFRINSDVKRGKFKIGESINYGRGVQRPEANTGFPGMYQTTNIQPLIHLYDANNEGGFGGAIPGLGMTDAANPVAFNQLISTKDANDYLAASGYVSFQPLDGLEFKFRAGRTMDFVHYKSFTPTYYVGANSVNTIANLTERRSKRIEDIMELTGTYSTTINDKHNLDALLGISQEENKFEDQGGNVFRFENNEDPYLGKGQDNASVTGGYLRSALRSGFGRLSYNYDYKYLAMFSARYDGSSRFGEGNEWGFFPSASIGWNIANEGFWEDLKGKVSNLKLRASYGSLGNQSIGNYMFIPRLSNNTYALNYPLNGNQVNLGYAIDGLPSSKIRWETTLYKNIGLDITLLNHKLDLTFEAYVKDTYDMLSSKNISLATGFPSLIVNEGKLKTKGLEFQANYKDQISDFKYQFDVNVSHYKSVLKEMSDPGYLFESGPARTYVGGEIGEFWVTQTAGIFQSEQEVKEWNQLHGSKDASGQWIPLQPAAKPGDIRFIDQNGDGKLDSYDRVFVGSGNPKMQLGFNINLGYKAFDLMANFYGNFGVKRFNYMKRQLQRMDKNFNYGKDGLLAWTPENTNTDIPRAVIGDPNGNIRISDRFVENGDYLRLNNLQIGYNLPASLKEKLNVNDLRIYAGATRLFTLTKYKGYDPGTGSETGKMGVDDAIYPLSRTFMMGIRVGF